MVPRLSSIGRQAAEQALAAVLTVASSSLLPISAFAASSTSSTVGATAPRPTRAAVQTPSFKVRLTPTPTTAMSISVRGIIRKYASEEPFGAGGDQRGHAVAGRRAVAEIAARRRPALHLGGTDQVDGLEQAGPDFGEPR